MNTSCDVDEMANLIPRFIFRGAEIYLTKPENQKKRQVIARRALCFSVSIRVLFWPRNYDS